MKRGVNGLTDGDEGDDPNREEFNCLREISEHPVDEINAVDDDDTGGYEKHEMLMDSGSSSSFLRKGVLAHLGMEQATKDEAKRSWSTASGGTVRMRGTTKVKFDTNEFAPKSLRLKRSDEVDKTIGSVSEFADKGNTLIFTKSGGAIVHDPGEKLAKQMMQQSGRNTPFRRNRGTYTLDMWVKKAFDEQNSKGAEKIEKGVIPESSGRTGDSCAAVMAVPAEAWRDFSNMFDESGFARRHL